MKKLFLSLVFIIFFSRSFSQPTYYFYDPANAGVNNLYFNTGVSYKFLFIFTQSELASTGITGPIQINSIWLKSNTAYSLTFDNLKFTVGHTTLSVPANIFSDNFDAGTPTVVLDEAVYNWTTIAGPWNDPPAGWTEIPLTTPFVYNFTDNFVLQGEYSDINYPIPIYANNGGIPITVYTDTYGGADATGSTARPMIGFSSEPPSSVAFSASDSSVCQKFCVDYSDFSSNNPVSWEWTFEDGSPATSSDQNPSAICYNNPGVFDVTLITTDAGGNSDTLVMDDFMTVYPTPVIPSVTNNNDTLTSTPADFYQWQLDNVDIPGATDQVYVAAVTGSYIVIVYDSNGCSSQSAAIEVTITGLENIPASELSIYPNPATEILIVDLQNVSSNNSVSFTLTNSFGQKVFSSSENLSSVSWKKEIDVSGLAGGVYFIEVISEENHVKKKVLVSR